MNTIKYFFLAFVLLGIISCAQETKNTLPAGTVDMDDQVFDSKILRLVKLADYSPSFSCEWINKNGTLKDKSGNETLIKDQLAKKVRGAFAMVSLANKIYLPPDHPRTLRYNSILEEVERICADNSELIYIDALELAQEISRKNPNSENEIE